MKDELKVLRQENKEVKDKLNEVTIMLYKKIEENTKLTKKAE
jgi:hypothetical protein